MYENDKITYVINMNMINSTRIYHFNINMLFNRNSINRKKKRSILGVRQKTILKRYIYIYCDG